MKVDVDVVIVGAGPTGLLLASKLPTTSVVVLDKSKSPGTSKFWLTTTSRLEKHQLQDTCVFRGRNATVGSFWGQTAYARGDFATVDDHKLLNTLLARCKNQGVTINYNEPCLDIRRENNAMAVRTTLRQITCSLVVDASGGGSLIAASFGSHKLRGFYSIYGYHLKDIDLADETIIGAHVLRFGHPLPLFELIPTGPTSAFCVVFIASKHAVDPQSLNSAFQEHLTNNPFLIVNSSSSYGEAKFGIIPIGRSKSRALPGLTSLALQE